MKTSTRKTIGWGIRVVMFGVPILAGPQWLREVVVGAAAVVMGGLTIVAVVGIPWHISGCMIRGETEWW